MYHDYATFYNVRIFQLWTFILGSIAQRRIGQVGPRRLQRWYNVALEMESDVRAQQMESDARSADSLDTPPSASPVTRLAQPAVDEVFSDKSSDSLHRKQ